MAGRRIAMSTARQWLSRSTPNTAGPSACFSTSSVYQSPPRFNGFVPPPPMEAEASARPSSNQRRDAAITARYIRLVDPTTDSLAGPFSTRVLLNKLDTKTFYLQQVEPAIFSDDNGHWDPNDPKAGETDLSKLRQFPICKLINKQEEQQRLRARRTAKKASKEVDAASSTPALTQKGTSKDVILTWNTTPHDLTHKLGNMKKEMLKGARINITIGQKGKSKPYVPGKDPRRDHEYHRLLAQVDEFMCKKDALTPAQLNKLSEDIDTSQPLATSNISAADEIVAGRMQDVEWKYNRGTAFLTYELVGKGKKQ